MTAEMEALNLTPLGLPTRSADERVRADVVRHRPGLARAARMLVVMADAVAVAGSMTLAAFLLERAGVPGAQVSTMLRLGALSLPLWLIVFNRYHLYDARHVTGRREELGRVGHAVGVSVVGTALVAYFNGELIARTWLVALFALALLSVMTEREVARHSFNVLRRRGHLLRPVVVAGTGGEAYALTTMLAEQPELGYRVVGLLGDAATIDSRLEGRFLVLDTRRKVPEQVQLLGASGVVMATTDLDLDTTNRLIRSLTDAGIHVELSSSLKDIDSDRLSVRPLGRFPVFYVEPVRRDAWRLAAKRAFDLAISVVVLLVSTPLWLAAAVAIKVSSPGPILFRQERVGRRGRRFHVFKLRTMVVDAEARLSELELLNEADGPLFKIRQDPRVTAVGRLLRKLSLDELPQLLNVLKGEMSLVGPRPALPSEVTQWTPELFERLRVQPGITGMWQVRGRSDSSFAQYQRWDLYYVDNWSIGHDLAILARTLPVVLSQKGAY